ISPKLQYLIPSAILGSAVSLSLLILVVTVTFPLRLAGHPRRSHVRPLFSYGAWVTITNLASPLLEAADRLLIGSMLGPKAVAYYQVPFNLAVRIRILPGVVSRTLFPRLSALRASNAAELSTSAVRGLAAVMTPLIVFGLFLMQPFLVVWTGQEFASKAASVGQLILVGVWINSLAYIPFTHLQAIGRPDIVARFHAVELVPFVGILWWSVHAFGLLGAALAWSARCAVDGLLLFWAARFGSRLTLHLYVPALLVIAAYVLARVLSWKTGLGVGVWIGLTTVSIVWAVKTTPSARDQIRKTMRLVQERALRRA
ncbi:MAG: hypothetical protein QOI13_325, partial [Paraburkholderia sp.]|nr:hypothetical protein [Paraburkholderia sp.]